MKRRLLVISSILLVVGIAIYGMNKVNTKNSILNRFEDSKSYGAPANPAFTDENFYKCVVDAYNSTNGTSVGYNTNLTDTQLQTISTISCSGYGKSQSELISNVNGLTKLTNLKLLELRNNNISSVDVSKNTLLNNLSLVNNNLTSIDVSKNTLLEYLSLSDNNISSINLSGLSKLSRISLDNNNLTSINTSTNSNLVSLDINGNRITNIDISYNPKLMYLFANNNSITTINTSNNLELYNLYLQNNNISSLNLSNNTNLYTMYLGGNKLNSIDVTSNKELTNLYLEDNNLSSINISQNVKLAVIYLQDNNLSSLDVSKNASLKTLIVDNNKLSSLDVTKNVKLEWLWIKNNNIKSIDLRNNVNLKYLLLGGNPYGGEKNIYKGKTVQAINSIVLPSNNAAKQTVWSTNNDALATVSDSGIISTKNTGTTTVVGTVHYIIGSQVGNGTITSTYDTTTKLNIFNITSSKYTINEASSYIYVGNETNNNTIINNITKSDSNIALSISNNKLQVKYGNELLKEFTIVSYSSSTYDLTKDYIYVGANTFDESKITVTNGAKAVVNNKLQIKYGSTVLKEIPIVSYSSSTYDLTKDYIYVGTSTFDESKIIVTNGTKAVSNNKLQIKYGSSVLKEIPIYSIKLNNLLLSNKTISLYEKTTYSDFVKNISVVGVTYKLFKDSEEVTSGNIENNTEIRVYVGSSKVDTYTVYVDYLDIGTEIQIDEEKKYITNVASKTTIEELKSKIDTNKELKVLDGKNREVTNNSVVGTGYKLQIISGSNIEEYTIVVNGDVTGDGIVDFADVVKLYRGYINKTSLKTYEIEAGDTADHDNKIMFNDVTKMYYFYRGRINKL